MVLIGQKTSDVPIFIVGTPRSGSTLLESVLDAHPSIAGLSEDSVFAGMHLKIQKKVAEIAQTNDALKLQNVVGELADEVRCFIFPKKVTFFSLMMHSKHIVLLRLKRECLSDGNARCLIVFTTVMLKREQNR